MIFNKILITNFLSDKRNLRATAVFLLLFLLLYTLLIFHSRKESHEICASEFCSSKGKEELFGLKKSVKRYDTCMSSYRHDIRFGFLWCHFFDKSVVELGYESMSKTVQPVIFT